MTKITGDAIALISKHTRFNPENPEATPAHQFVLLGPSTLDEAGQLGAYWSGEGYIYVGHAKIEIDLLPQKEVTTQAVASLKKQKTKILADAQAEVTRIEGQIQSLLAITNEAG